MHRRGGSRIHPGIVSSGWGLSTLWLLWDISRGWIRYYGCSRRHRRRCFGTLNWIGVCGSPVSARGISGRRTGLNPGPISMSSSLPNHYGRLANGNWGRPTVGQGRNGRIRCWRELSGPKLVVKKKKKKKNGGALFMVFMFAKKLKGPPPPPPPFLLEFFAPEKKNSLQEANFRYYNENFVLH